MEDHDGGPNRRGPFCGDVPGNRLATFLTRTFSFLAAYFGAQRVLSSSDSALLHSVQVQPFS